jgi:hypothetical protein
MKHLNVLMVSSDGNLLQYGGNCLIRDGPAPFLPILITFIPFFPKGIYYEAATQQEFMKKT